MSENKFVGRSVAIALGIACILLIAGLGGAMAYYTMTINSKDSTYNGYVSTHHHTDSEFNALNSAYQNYRETRSHNDSEYDDYVGNHTHTNGEYDAMQSNFTDYVNNHYYTDYEYDLTRTLLASDNAVRAYQYLVDSYNPALGLCYEYNGSNTYWITHDNVLASYVLQQWNRTIADNITLTVWRLAQEYSLPTSQTGIALDNKIEILLGYIAQLPFNATQTITLNQSYYGAILGTEKATNTPMLDFENYTDLSCYASLIELRNNNLSGALYYFESVTAKWDGKGFNDVAYNATVGYETYKLGLFYLVSETLGKDFQFKKDLIETVRSCQADNGGFKTHYSSKGELSPTSMTNTETTSIILLANT